MLAKPMAREPPARGSSPRRPRKSMEMREREYRRRLVRTMGKAIWKMEKASLMAKEKWVLVLILVLVLLVGLCLFC